MTAAQRVSIPDEVSAMIDDATIEAAHAIMEATWEMQQREQREMTLDEALQIVADISRKIEAI